jgi:hypothetical protein
MSAEVTGIMRTAFSLWMSAIRGVPAPAPACSSSSYLACSYFVPFIDFTERSQLIDSAD